MKALVDQRRKSLEEQAIQEVTAASDAFLRIAKTKICGAISKGIALALENAALR
jgi:hypothetical protein